MAAVPDPPADGIVIPVETVDRETASPPPLSDTVCGELPALSVIATVPVRVPAAVGVKVTGIVQFAPAATLAPHVWVCAKSPDAVIEVTVRTAVPELVSVTIWATLVVPSGCEAKVRLIGERVTVGAVTVGVVTVTELVPAELS